jgi:predicted HicB family RNase H-like nuclease
MQEKTVTQYHVQLYRKLQNRIFKSYPGPLQCRLNNNLAELLIAEADAREIPVGTLIAEKLSTLLIAENLSQIEGYIAQNDV